MKNYCALLFVMFLVACAPTHKGDPAYEQSYVSATSNEQEYVSALNAAMAEYAAEQKHDNGYVSPITAEKPAVSGKSITRITHNTYNSAMWTQAPSSEGKGMVLADEEAQARLNDALQTTPSGSKASWEMAGLSITVIPNSPLYTPHHSGGRCRDAVVAINGADFYDEAKRGLFCQQGNSASWLLQLP